jgi:hypothetical protein
MITARPAPRWTDDRKLFIAFALTCVWSGGALLLPDEYIHQLAWIDRGVLFLKPENHRQHPQVNFLLALI